MKHSRNFYDKHSDTLVWSLVHWCKDLLIALFPFNAGIVVVKLSPKFFQAQRCMVFKHRALESKVDIPDLPIVIPIVEGGDSLKVVQPIFNVFECISVERWQLARLTDNPWWRSRGEFLPPVSAPARVVDILLDRLGSRWNLDGSPCMQQLLWVTWVCSQRWWCLQFQVQTVQTQHLHQ